MATAISSLSASMFTLTRQPAAATVSLALVIITILLTATASYIHLLVPANSNHRAYSSLSLLLQSPALF
jgi:hypothetical protein